MPKRNGKRKPNNNHLDPKILAMLEGEGHDERTKEHHLVPRSRFRVKAPKCCEPHFHTLFANRTAEEAKKILKKCLKRWNRQMYDDEILARQHEASRKAFLHLFGKRRSLSELYEVLERPLWSPKGVKIFFDESAMEEAAKFYKGLFPLPSGLRGPGGELIA